MSQAISGATRATIREPGTGGGEWDRVREGYQNSIPRTQMIVDVDAVWLM